MKSLIFSAVFLLIASSSLSAQSTQVTGRNVTFIKFGNNTTSFLGTYVKRGGSNTWEEEGTKQGVTNFKFRETHRDDWSVYLVDDSRGVNIQLDLHTKKVMYSDRNNPQRRHLYNITERYAGPNGWTVCVAQFGHSNGGTIGSFVQKNTSTWIEKNASGVANFTFREVGRDEWSVYLKDDSRGVEIQLDLHTKKIMYSDRNTPRRVQYFIKRVS